MYYFQSKKPGYFGQFLEHFPENVLLVTTLETNRNRNYRDISRAPIPSDRYRQFKALDWPSKVVTIEPILDFDIDIFSGWLIDLKPQHVWLGFNSRPKQSVLPEPSEDKVKALMGNLQKAGIEIKEKDMRKIQLEEE